jgi:enoyl-CoA hydratase
MTPPPPTTSKMLAHVENGIGWMTFNNPERHNAVSYEMRLAILDILERFETDPSVRVIVIKGAGDKSFVSGSDISQFDANRATAEQQAEYERVSVAVLERYLTLNKPLIAMIQGYCLGGGLQTALSADIRVASENASFGIPAGKLGIAYPVHSVRRLIETVGPPKAKEILFTARRFTAAEALQMGLVNQVVPHGELEKTVREMAATIAANAPLSVLSSKRTAEEIIKDPADRNMAKVKAGIDRAMASDDFKEGRKAFMEKRKPQWTGK